MDKFERLKRDLRKGKAPVKVDSSKSISIEEFKKFGYDPNQEQIACHQSKADFKLLIGSPRSGKTCAMLIEILTHLLRYPHARGYLSRQHETEFRKTIFSELDKWLKKIPYVEDHNKKLGKVVFLNGSELLYGGLWQAEDKLKGLEISVFGGDQCEEMSEIIFKTLASRLSLDIPERKGFLTCNIAVPEWAKARFVESPELYHKHFKFYPQNNKFLPKDYLKKQKEIWGEEYFQAMLACDLDYIQTEDNIFEGNEIKEAFEREKISGKRSIGVDPARGGMDETSISEKKGNHLRVLEAYRKKDTNYTVERIEKIAGDKETPIFIDMGSFGAAIYDSLKKSGFNIIGEDFSTSPKDKRKYNIRKAEIIFKLKDDLINLSITDDSILKEQLGNIRYSILNDEKIRVETKLERIRRGLKSYDRLMSIALANLEETEQDFEIGEDERGVYELDNGKKIYLINYLINISQMTNQGRIGKYEIIYDPETITENDLNRLKYTGQIRMGWIERRKEFFEFVRKYELTGKKDWGEGLKFKF